MNYALPLILTGGGLVLLTVCVLSILSDVRHYLRERRIRLEYGHRERIEMIRRDAEKNLFDFQAGENARLVEMRRLKIREDELNAVKNSE